MTEQQRKAKNVRGFTLIELMIVMTIIGILASIAAPNYQRSVIKAREAVLMEDLYQMRKAIDAFFADKGKYPGGLEELVSGKYLRAIPTDPFTNASNTWQLVAPTPIEATDGVVPEVAEGSVENVHSGSDLVGLNGTPYREW
jgi:general secretion pathway protein G